MNAVQIEARKILLNHMKKYYRECRKDNIKKEEANRAVLTLAMSILFNSLDKDNLLGESTELATKQVEAFAKDTYNTRLKNKFAFLAKSK